MLLRLDEDLIAYLPKNGVTYTILMAVKNYMPGMWPFAVSEAFGLSSLYGEVSS